MSYQQEKNCVHLLLNTFTVAVDWRRKWVKHTKMGYAESTQKQTKSQKAGNITNVVGKKN